ncbi:hypothetical protein U1Q18_029545 [Sarracenia purpurea var. burkii]
MDHITLYPQRSKTAAKTEAMGGDLSEGWNGTAKIRNGGDSSLTIYPQRSGMAAKTEAMGGDLSVELDRGRGLESESESESELEAEGEAEWGWKRKGEARTFRMTSKQREGWNED